MFRSSTREAILIGEPLLKEKPAISVIVCSRNLNEVRGHLKSVRETIGTTFEYIKIDNRRGDYGICAAYNLGVARSKADILVFAHEDMRFHTGNWGKVLQRKFKTEKKLGLIGIAGTTKLARLIDGVDWRTKRSRYECGWIIQSSHGRESRLDISASGRKKRKDTPAVVVDGVFFACRRELFDRVRFDEKLFDGFHFYDVDICMQIRETHHVLVTYDILIEHYSEGNINDTWLKYALRFNKKYFSRLPVTVEP